MIEMSCTDLQIHLTHRDYHNIPLAVCHHNLVLVFVAFIEAYPHTYGLVLLSSWLHSTNV